MPGENDLPETLAPLSKFNAYEVRDTTFDQDVSHLIAETKLPPHLDPFRLMRDRPASLVALACAVIAAIILSV